MLLRTRSRKAASDPHGEGTATPEQAERWRGRQRTAQLDAVRLRMPCIAGRTMRPKRYAPNLESELRSRRAAQPGPYHSQEIDARALLPLLRRCTWSKRRWIARSVIDRHRIGYGNFGSRLRDLRHGPEVGRSTSDRLVFANRWLNRRDGRDRDIGQRRNRRRECRRGFGHGGAAWRLAGLTLVCGLVLLGVLA